MTSEARDASVDQGEPLKLYVFTRASKTWRYTDADRIIFYNGDAYAPAPITCTEIQDGGEQNKVQITVTIPKSIAVASIWRPYPPSDPIAITIMTQHDGETDMLVDWVGRIMQPTYNDTTIDLISEPTSTMARHSGQGRIWQRGCDLLLYSTGTGKCNVDETAHALAATLTAVAGLTLTADVFGTLPDGRLAGGFIEWTRAADGLLDRRSIDSHAGTSIVIEYAAEDLIVGLALTAKPGCGQTWADCTYYNNTDNYGGELFIPGRDYFDGLPIN